MQGAKATSLAAAAAELKACSVDAVDRAARLAPFVLREAADYKFPSALLTLAHLLRALLKSSHEIPKDPLLLQLNHVRVLEPASSQGLPTNDGSRHLAFDTHGPSRASRRCGRKRSSN